MKNIIVAIIMLAVGFGGAYLLFAGSDANGHSTHSALETNQQYSCGMHPDIISDEPGICPICNMKLTPIRNGGESSGSNVKIDPTVVQNIGLKTVTPVLARQSKSINLFGKVAATDKSQFDVNLKFNGWVEKLFVDTEGEMVFEGQPLLEIYSPELVTAQQELLIAYKSSESDSRLLESAKDRLRNWDIPDSAIDKLIESKEIQKNLIIRAPSSGIVKKKFVDDGARLKAGAKLYQIVDLSTVWVVAYAYEQDLPYLSEGQDATVSFPGNASTPINTKVEYVAPYLNNKGQVEIRVSLENNDNQIKPEMYTELDLNYSSSESRLTVPQTAIINSGKKKVLFVVEMDGGYAPRKVTTGIIGDNDMIEILSGLNDYDQVVVSGQFLLDSESRLGEAITAGGHNHGGMENTSDSESNDPHAGHDHSKMEMKAVSDTAGIYTCPMPVHFDVLQFGEGSCSKCGMDLVPLEETDNKEVYTCPMRSCGVVQNSPGECPVCGMDLIKAEKEASDDK